MKTRIEIDTKTFVRFWLVVFGFAFAIFAMYSARAALIIIGVAFFLALALNAPVSFLARHIPGKSRVGGTALAYLIVVAILAMIVFLVIPPIVEQTVKFAQTVPGLIDRVVEQSRVVNDLVVEYNLQGQVANIQQTVENNVTQWATNVGSNVLSGVGSFLASVAAGFLVLVLSFLMLIEGPTWLGRLWGVYNNKERMESHRDLIHRMYKTVTGYVMGQLAISFIGALLAGIAVFILSLFLNIPTNLAIPTVAITFTLSLIPMFGATISGVLISLLLAFNDVSAGIIFAAYFIIYQQIENNFIAPAIQSRTVELSALAILVSVTIGLYVFGLAGGIISIPIAASLKILLEDYLARARKNRKKSERPMRKLVEKLREETS